MLLRAAWGQAIKDYRSTLWHISATHCANLTICIFGGRTDGQAPYLLSCPVAEGDALRPSLALVAGRVPASQQHYVASGFSIGGGVPLATPPPPPAVTCHRSRVQVQGRAQLEPLCGRLIRHYCQNCQCCWNCRWNWIRCLRWKTGNLNYLYPVTENQTHQSKNSNLCPVHHCHSAWALFLWVPWLLVSVPCVAHSIWAWGIPQISNHLKKKCVCLYILCIDQVHPHSPRGHPVKQCTCTHSHQMCAHTQRAAHMHTNTCAHVYAHVHVQAHTCMHTRPT